MTADRLILPGYTIVEEIHRGRTRSVYRAFAETSGQPLIIKAGGETMESGSSGLEREATLLRSLAIDGVPRFVALERGGSRPALVVEDLGGDTLAAVIDSGALGLAERLRVGRNLARVLEGIHDCGIVHRDLNPNNAVVDTATLRVGILDFGLALRPDDDASTEDFETGRDDVAMLEGTPAYVSPEQTGRTAWRVDHRSDLYSLGATLYELLTGRRPFESSDALRIVHAHIAIQPVPPHELDSSLPRPVGEIILKLLSKSPDDRYQSAAGVAVDLDDAVRQLEEHGHVKEIEIGRHDLGRRLVLPHRLYGRDREIAELSEALERSATVRGEVLLVGGYSGVGKTSLVLELARRLSGRGGRFVSGKFDQFVRGTPYTAIRQSLRELARQILAASDEDVGRWREAVLEAVGTAGQVILDLVPELEAILGPQPAVPELGPTEAQNRFNRVFREFLQAATDPSTPLLLFLDDVQWIDSASLDLLRVALAGWAEPGLLIVGAYRDNEVGEDHPLVPVVREVEASGTPVSRLSVGPLDDSALAGFVTDVLRGGEEHAAPLARIVAAKTNGNPFFVSQFMTSLAEERLLIPDRESGVWTYDLGGIEAQPSTDNVVDLLLGRIERLPEDCRRALRTAACLGNRFDARTLGIACEERTGTTVVLLHAALTEGLVLPEPAGGPGSAGGPGGFRFLHDRVQQAAYARIPEDDRPGVHLEIGRSLFRALDPEEREERAFELIDQISHGLGLLTDPEERRGMLELARVAGSRARAAAAYAEALAYFEVASRLLPPDAWSSEYDLTFDLTLSVAEAQYLSGRFSDGFATLDELSAHAKSPLDGARVQILRAAQHETMSEYDRAVEALRQGLVPLGIDFPEAERFDEALEQELDETERAVGNRAIESLIDLPPLDDDAVKMCMRLLAFAWAPSYLLADVRMISWIPARMVRLSLEHGNTEESALGYVVHGFTLGTRRGDYRRGREFGLLGVALNDALGDLRLRGKVHELFGCFVNQWRRPLAECIESQRTAFLAGIEGGDFAYGSYGGFVETWYAMLTRPELEGLETDYAVVLDFLESIKNESFTAAERLILNWARALRGGTAAPTSLDGAGFSEREFLAGFGQAPFFRVFHDMIKLHLHLTWGELDEAVRQAERAEEVIHSVSGTIWPALLRCYRGVAIAARRRAGDALAPPEDARLRDDLAQIEVWAENCPANFLHAERLIRAELARIRCEDVAAQDLYREAIAAARTRGFPGDLGLANERYARYWLDRGQRRIGALFLFEALRVYEAWGARPKAARLSTELASLVERDAGDRNGGTARALASPAAVLATLQSPSAALDLEWTMQAAGAIASEIEVDRLLETLMRTLLESAGAERGGLVLSQQEEPVLRIWIEADAGTGALEETPLAEADRLPVTLVRYVWRTRSEVVLQDASADSAYAADPYVKRKRPLSVLCLPVLYQNELLGVVYLENNLNRGAFTRSHLHLLETLSAHAAIALRNAELFQEVAALQERLQAENVYLQEEIRTHHEFEDIVGESPQLMKVLEQVEQVAGTDTTVLILGETGTGKELLARAIHRLSPRADRPLVTVNCGAISPGLIESELFGHEKGAFTGATARKFGRFELADQGTILLDEIGDLAPDLQVKLLRVLQEGEIERVGGTRTIPVDVRVIAGTHRDLEAGTEDGTFRQDLYYRLNVFPIRNPPLRDRREDIPLLVRYFLMKDGTRLGKRLETIPRRTMDALMSYDWPGNVRELRNVIERSIITSPGRALELGNWLRSDPVEPEPEGDLTLDELQRAHIERTLQRTGWVVSGPNGAAVRLGVKPTTLEARMKKLGIERPK